jgi:glycosyltransferase involved in cell wall biosynthesis
MMDIKAYLPATVRSLAKRFVAGIESCGCRWLDGVVTADCGTMRRLGKIGGSRKLVFYNFPNLAFFKETSRSQKEFDLVYRGGFSDRTGMPVLLDALARLASSERPVKLLLIGYWDNPATLERLKRRISDLDLTALVEVHGRIDHETMCREISRARVGVCPLMPIEKFLRNIPVKVWEYWACGLPVVATDLPPIRPFFGSARSGLLVEPGNSIALADAIRRILDNPTLAQSMSREGEQAVRERYNNANETNKLFCFYTKLLARKE